MPCKNELRRIKKPPARVGQTSKGMSAITAVDIVEPEANMKENQNWATFDDNDKDEFWKRSEFEWDKDLHTDRKINANGFENENELVASPIVSFNKSESLEGRDLYLDKNRTECELPELVICYRENPVKDICVDDGVPTKEKIFVDGENINGLVSDPEVKIEFGTYECEATREVFTLDESKPLTSNDNDDVIGCDNEVNHSAIGKITNVVLSERQVADDTQSLGKARELKSLKSLFDSRDLDGSDVEHLSEKMTHPKTSSESPTLGSPDDDSNKGNSGLSYNSKVESGSITFDFNSIKLEPECIDESPDDKDNTRDQSVKVNSLPAHDSTISNNVTEENKVQYGPGESSFSMAGPGSGLISHSGSIPYSGSFSVRSDSSTTSARSFAFPILPNEWNSSPVRMAKADRRRYRKKSWRNGLFCCRF